jgi:hypothetical protein
MAPENFYFGGGATESTMHPLVLACILIVVVLMLALPRKKLFGPVAATAILAPFGSQLFVGGFHFFVFRLVILGFACRLILVKVGTKGPLLSGGMTASDITFFAWAMCRGVASVLLHWSAAACANQVAFWLDAFGAYVLFRYIFRDYYDVLPALKLLAMVEIVLAGFMAYEHITGFNVTNLFRTIGVVPWVREEVGAIRAQASFAHSISAGGFGATMLPLFYWLWKSGGAKVLGPIGVIGSLVVVFCSQSSTPFMAFAGGVLALALWAIRKHMRKVRWGFVVLVSCLALVMKAPVWYIIARAEFVGGHGWDRAYLLDQCWQHFSSWWLIGTSDTAHWGVTTWDLCNQFVAEACSGGILTLCLFIGLLYHAFRVIGLARQRAEATGREWLYWCLGCSLFAHILMFEGLSYYDQMQTMWFMFLALAPAAATVPEAPRLRDRPPIAPGPAVKSARDVDLLQPQTAAALKG